MITLEKESLVFRFPEVNESAICRIVFHRTLRLPDDGRTYPLPAGLGRFPLRHTDDFASRLPAAITQRGGVIMPMWQAEAMWMGLLGFGYPFAVKIAAGKINAVSGEPWSKELRRRQDPRSGVESQDYVVVPEQRWLDGFCIDTGLIRQFVAAPLGHGITAEEQLTGAGEYGGIQIVVHPMKAEAYRSLFTATLDEMYSSMMGFQGAASMGLAAGGLMRQEICSDPHHFDMWDLSVSSRCFVSILNATDWHAVTGERPPTQPISADDYRRYGIPWFDFYAADAKALPGSARLRGLKSAKDFASFGLPWRMWKQQPIDPTPTIDLGPDRRSAGSTKKVREMEG